MSQTLWAQVSTCFDTDDGSLPGITISNLSPAGVSAVYAMLRQRSRPAGDPAEFWSHADEASVPVDSVSDAAALVASGQAAPFHHCVAGIISGGAELPVIGIFVFQDAVELDYRMGSEWDPEKVAGFFELLRDCCALDPAAFVMPADQEGPPDPERFVRAWSSYRNCSQ